MSYSLGDVFETVADNIEDGAPAILCDGTVLDWKRLDRDSNALARRLLAAGVQIHARVGLYLRNGPDYIIAFAACLKARLCPFNINFRYGVEEVGYLLDNADCDALVFDAEFAEVAIAASRFRPQRLLAIARGETPNAESLDAIYSGNGDRLSIVRDSSDLVMIYTGGTTGLPKGVMWPSGAIWDNLVPGLAAPGQPPPTTLTALAEQIRSGAGRYRFYIAPPLMHGTGLLSALGILFMGGSVVMTGRAGFDAEKLLDEVVALGCQGIVIVGDAFARPMVDAIKAHPGRYDLGQVRAISSSGMMWSPEVKQAMLAYMPTAYMIDGLGATESSSFASSMSSRDSPPGEARFLSNGAVVLRAEDLLPVRPGSGEIGLLAKAGPLPLGYHKDPERTARTYVTINGVRHVIGGDHATVDSDGTIRLLGRGNLCINTAGEKVYPEEVEQCLKTHPDVVDALVFGVPDERYGQAVAAVVSVSATISSPELIAHVRNRLAHYKAPKRITLVSRVPRAPNGKADYPAARAMHAAAGAA